ncbi:MAG: type II secretion system F family protein [Candidatus Diapherotrites archaeon]
MPLRIGLLLFSVERTQKINRHFIWIGHNLSRIFFNVKFGLAKAGINLTPEKYLTASFFSALVYGLIFFTFFYGLFFLRDGIAVPENSLIAAFIGVVFFLVFFLLHTIYPALYAKKYAAGIDQSLMFALKSMLIQVSSGVSLFESMVNISKSNFGVVSKEFEKVVKDVSSGESEAKALEKLALRTQSEYLKKTSWQLLTSLRSGASLKGALTTVVTTLNSQQLRAIKDYSAELNLWILLYLLLAAAIPTLGITFLVILSAMGGVSFDQNVILFTILGAATMQIVLIGFVKTRVPKVYLS